MAYVSNAAALAVIVVSMVSILQTGANAAWNVLGLVFALIALAGTLATTIDVVEDSQVRRA